MRLYRNGVEGGAVTFSARTLNQTTDPLNLSRRVGSSQYFFDGLIDDVRVYTRALSADEVAAVVSGDAGAEGGGSCTYSVQWRMIP